MNTVKPFYIQLLEKELQRRKKLNPYYSLRSFAMALGLNSGALSLILNGKRFPSLNMAHRILSKINLSVSDKSAFLESLVKAHKERNLKKVSRKVRSFTKIGELSKNKVLNLLEEDFYSTISDWYHVTIMEMTRLDYFKYSHKWIAGQLGISEIEVKLAIERLLHFGLLTITDKGDLRPCKSELRLEEMYTSTSIARREKQKQIRQKSIQSIDNTSIDKRSMTSMTMCIDMSLIPQAKELISQFNESMATLMESGPKEKVYALEVSLFPLQNIGDQND